ncbi:MAG: hypothetical protein ABI556_06305 [Gemmatimonadales bacterium]
MTRKPKIFGSTFCLFVLVSCTDVVSPPDSSNPPGKSCQVATVPTAGDVGILAPSSETDLCIRIPAGTDRYFLAFADVRQIERARTGPAAAQVDADYDMFVRGVKRQNLIRPELAVPRELDETRGAPIVKSQQPDPIFCAQNPASPLCHEKPWELGERFADQRGLRYVAFAIEGQLVLALEEKQFEASTVAGRQVHIDMAKRILAIHLPLQEKIFGPLAFTSAGSEQTLILLGANVGAHAIIISDGTTARGFVEAGFSGSDQDPYSTFYIYGHELAHIGQFRWGWELDPLRRKQSDAERRGYWGMPSWASEGGADFLACESIREEAGIPWGGNLTLDLDAPGAAGWYSRCLQNGSGNVEDGYASGAKYMRTVAEGLVSRGVPVETARREIARGTLEGWFGIDDANLRFTGLAQRVASLSGVPFDPAMSLLNSAMQNALDDVMPASAWNITSTRDAWRYWGYHASMTASADTAAVKVFDIVFLC